MKQKRTYVTLLLVVALLCLGIAFAAISAVPFKVTGTAAAVADQSSFKVKFDLETAPTTDVTGSEAGTATATYIDEENATITVEGLKVKGEKVTATYTIENESVGLGADLTKTSATVTNTDYFNVTQEIATDNIGPNEKTTLTVTVELIKSPTIDNVSTDVNVVLTATPVEL